MAYTNFNQIVREAWEHYDPSREIVRIVDVSAKVSTNHVYRITLKDRNFIIAKLSYFGKYEHFLEDHTIINSLSNNLPFPYENFLARSLMKGNELFVYRFQDDMVNAWVVFYRPVKTKTKLPRRLDEDQIKRFANEAARFHIACTSIRYTLPKSSKTMLVDIQDLTDLLDTEPGRFAFREHLDLIYEQCEMFIQNYTALDAGSMDRIPVFVDWNIGNFSVTPGLKLYSRWDYDWFRMSSRIMDFYFFSRVVSDAGDRTVFTYNMDVLTQDRFLLFLKTYHNKFPLTENEILFLKECYRFFLLNYVVKYGNYFFHEVFARKLQKEAFETHLPSIEKEFKPKPLLSASGF
ncbi:MAG: hypothetical protein MI700_11135 [Balneolales bacterium]|nr:hypothetical protein [Balneolales bacterium]